MKYRSIKDKNYKYKLLELEIFLIEKPKLIKPIKEKYFIFNEKNKNLKILKGYCWDGPSGPAIDTKDFMRGSLVHDCLYQLIREGYIRSSYRKKADTLLRKICREDGMSLIRSIWVYLGVRIFGWRAVRKEKN